MASFGDGLYRDDRVPVTSLGAVTQYNRGPARGGLRAQSQTHSREGARGGGGRGDTWGAPCNAPRPAVARTRDPVSSPCPHESSGRGLVPGTRCHAGCPQWGPQCGPQCRQGLPEVRAGPWPVCAGHEGRAQRAPCWTTSSLRSPGRRAQCRAFGTCCPARACPCHHLVTRHQGICPWQMLPTARASCPRVDRPITESYRCR